MSTSFEAVHKILNQRSNELIFVKDHNSNYLEANENFLNHFGIENVEQLREINDYDLPAASLAEKYIHDDQDALQLGEIQVIEPTLRHDGGLIIMLTHKYSFYDNATQRQGIVGIARVIHDINIKKFLDLAYKNDLKNFKVSDSLFEVKVNQHVKKLLTKRELDVLYYLLHGSSQKQIADKLNLSVRTVEDHVDHVKTKLNCFNKNQLFEFALHHGLMNIIPKQHWR